MNPVQTPSPVTPTTPHTTTPPETTNQDVNKPKTLAGQPAAELAAIEHTRRVSVSSVSSESSFSSIDSLSTTSDLGVTDLVTVRTQLELLDDRHDRVLYDAAVDLRQQLTVLQESRREAKFSGNKNWKAGFSQSQQNTEQAGNSDWGRWDSPEQQQRNSVDRRALKEEMRATKKAFRDVLRRARDEQRERRRTKRRQLRQARVGNTKQSHDRPLDQQFGTLRLDDPRSNQSPMSRPVTQAQPNLVSSISSNVGSEAALSQPSISTTSTQDLASPSGSGTSVKNAKQSDTSSRLKGMLKSRKAKKQKEEDDAKSK
jgi:hypothetical protein